MAWPVDVVINKEHVTEYWDGLATKHFGKLYWHPVFGHSKRWPRGAMAYAPTVSMYFFSLEHVVYFVDHSGVEKIADFLEG